MTNMSYCRFENTSADLIDCVLNWDDTDLSEAEQIGKESIILSAKELLEMEGYTVTKNRI